MVTLFMRQTTLCGRLSAIVLVGASMAFSGQQIDLRGHVVDIQDAGIKNAIAQLATEKVTDTTDSAGDFHLVGSVNTIAGASGENGNSFFSFDRNSIVLSRNIHNAVIELFDISGKKIFAVRLVGNRGANRRIDILGLIPRQKSSLYIIKIDDGVHPSFRTIVAVSGGPSGSSTAARREILAKRSAVIDTLVIAKDGYAGKKIGITDFKQNLGNIQLLREEDMFAIRAPKEKSLLCRGGNSGKGDTLRFYDIDLVCDCRNDSLQATIYVQTSPDSCVNYPYYGVVNAWIKINGKVSPLQSAAYYYGGNHHNDQVVFSYGGHTFNLFHSSMGFGGRACAEPDCMQICEDAQCRTIKFNGCARQACSDRPTLKVTCVQVEINGSVPPLLDPWVAQIGYTDYPLLPCHGDSYCK
jgi:hypothetical protein